MTRYHVCLFQGLGFHQLPDGRVHICGIPHSSGIGADYQPPTPVVVVVPPSLACLLCITIFLVYPPLLLTQRLVISESLRTEQRNLLQL